MQGNGHGITAYAQIGRKTEAVTQLFAGLEILKDLLQVVGVSAINLLTEPVLDQIAEHQLGNVAVYSGFYL
ncbi:hypothetical protein D3C84_993430 [compost metagenome]